MPDTSISITTPGQTVTIEYEGSLDATELEEVIVAHLVGQGLSVTPFGIKRRLHPVKDPVVIEQLVDAARQGNDELVLKVADHLRAGR